VIAEKIAAGAAALQQELPAIAVTRLVTLLSELQRWGKRINLTSILDADQIVNAHILDSLAVRPFVRGPKVIDIGTGAGFPGLPLAIVEPDITFVLLDSNGKKVSFVNHMIGELGLSNATAVKARAEDYAPGERFDTVIARALALLPRLVELSAHLVREDGQLLALKGKHPATELEPISASAEWEYRVTELTVPGLEGHARHVVSVHRTKTGIK
jgi:16S rRNA (guanine527-N7)-methyltransferase